jgi:hypothetical protein
MYLTKNYNLRAYTHTVQMVAESCLKPFEDINSKVYMTRAVKATTRGILFPINVNKYVDRDVTSYTEFLALIEEIRNDLWVDKWRIDRQDIAIDSTMSYDELFKINNMFMSLFGIYRGKPDKISDIRGQRDKKKRQLLYSDSHLELAIYDKALESGGKYPYNRCEFRFKLLTPNSSAQIFKKLYQTLDALPNCIEQLNKDKTDILYKAWLEESKADYKNTSVKSLPEFFRRYGNDIFTVDIARGLYNKVLNGKYDNWIRKLRDSGTHLHFIGKTEIRAYCKAIKQAVKSYEKHTQKGV